MASGIISWLLSIVGITLIGALVDIILPEGSTQKYIKCIFSIFVVFVMIYPVVNINIDKIDFNKFIYNNSSIELNQEYINNYHKSYKKSLEKLTENQLDSKGYKNTIVEIYYNMSSNNFEIEKVEINAKNLVINNETVHIDKYKEIKKIVSQFLYLDENKVVINEWRKEKFKTNGQPF